MSNRGECLLAFQSLAVIILPQNNLVTDYTLKLLLIKLASWVYDAWATVYQTGK